MMKKLVALFLAACMVFALAACGGSAANSTEAPATTNSTAPASTASAGSSGTEASADASKVGGTVRVGLNSAPVSENIWCQNDLNSATIMNLVVPNPVTMNADGVKINYLVESSEANEDCTIWTIVLKEGLCWNDGTPVTSSDVLFGARYGTEHHVGFFDSYYGLVDFDKSSCIDDRTVEFVLTSANVNFWNGAGYWMPFMRESEWSSVEDPTTHDYSGAGYGPYYVAEWVDGEYVVLERNPYFTLANNGVGAYIDQVIFRVFTDENAMVLALQNGEVDVCANFLGASSVSQLSTDPKYQIETVGSLGYAFISFSQTNKLLQDVVVRQAIASCCDRDALVNVAMLGEATPMYTPVSPVYGDLTASNIRQPAFNPDAAAAMLEAAGYVDSDNDGIRESADGDKLSFTITYKGTLTNVDGVMSILKSDMAKAGIELVLQPVDAATFSANVTQGHVYDISYSSWGTIDDVDTTLLTCFGIGQTLNFMEFNSQEQEDLLQAMQGETDYAKRIDLLDQWQTWFVENLPTCHLFVPANTYVADTTNFAGWHIVPGNSNYMNCDCFTDVYAK